MKIKKKTYFQVFRPIFFFIYHFWMGFCWKRKKSPKIYCNITSFLIIKAKKLFLIPCEISENVLLPMHCGACAHAHASGMGAPYQNGDRGALWCTCSYFCSSYQYLKMHCNMGKFCFLSAMCFMSPISGDPFKSKYFARGPSTHKSLTFRLNKTFSFWNDLSAFVLLLLLLVKARKVFFLIHFIFSVWPGDH